MSVLLDVVIVVIVLLGIFLGYRHGFVWTITKLVGCVVALVLASYLSQTVAEGIFDSFFQENLETTIAGQLPDTDGASLKTEISNALANLPGSVKNVLDNSGWIDRAMAEIDDLGTYQAADVARSVVTYVVRPVAVSLLSMVAFLILFILFMIAVSLLARLVGKLLRLPVLRQVDGILGAVLGTVEGVVVSLVVVAVLQIVAASASSDAWITRQDIENTVIVSALGEINPITDALNVVPDAA